MAKNGNYTEPYNGGRHYEHRDVASKILGRPLTEQETVHHINGNGFDNRTENIWIFKTVSDHTKFHRNGIALLQEDGTYITITRIKKPENICPICGNLCFRKFCSLQCANLDQRKVKRPSVETILKMLETMSYCAIARQFGVTDNAIRKWIKVEKLEVPRRRRKVR
jgi:hypothetical protein